jgi:hypothetical protein
MNRVKLFTMVITLFTAGNCLFSQESITAVKEIIDSVRVGQNANEIKYDLNEEGFYSPKGPIVDQKGRLIFLPNTTADKIQVYADGQYQDEQVPSAFPLYTMLNRNFKSQYGFSSNPSGYQLLCDGVKYYYYNYYLKTGEYIDYDEDYIMLFGTLLYSEKSGTGMAIVFDVKHPSEDFTIVREDKLKSWLPTQPGGFSIGDDGLLYRNGMVWSAVRPTDSTEGENYIGRLMSGHTVWMGPRESEYRYIVIANTKGKTELKVEIPWGEADNRPLYMYDSSLGPWGELYCLLPPAFVVTGQRIDDTGEKRLIYGPPSAGTAELVVVRNYLKYFGRLNDDKVRLRKGPSTTTESLGTYPVKTGFRILEKGTAEETIGGQKNVWYKVRLLDGTEGWFFGAFVHNLYDGPNGNPPPWPNVADW